MERIAKRNILSGISGRFTAGDITDTHAHNKQPLLSVMASPPFFVLLLFASAVALLLYRAAGRFENFQPIILLCISFFESSSGAFLSFSLSTTFLVFFVFLRLEM
jgi:hypothetical protein